MTSIFSPRRTKSTKGGAADPLPETPATLATAHAAAFVKAKRDGDLLVTTHVEEKKGKETEHIVQILRFGMKMTGEQVLAKVVADFQLDKKKSEKLVPYFPHGGVYMDLTRPLDQYVMGTTETLELRPFKKPRGTLLVILYEMGKVEQIDVWSKTTVLGVLMSITAKTENTVNECVLCTPEPAQELPLEMVVPKSTQKLVFLKRSRVSDKVPRVPLFPSRSYLIEQFNAKFQTTMYVPPDIDVTTPPSSNNNNSNSSINSSSSSAADGSENTPSPSVGDGGESNVVVDVSAYEAPTTPPPAHIYTPEGEESEGDCEQEGDTEQESEDSAAPIATPTTSLPEKVAASATPSATSPRAASLPVIEVLDILTELMRESDAQTRYARLIELLESDPIPEPRVVAATFKEWFTQDAQFKHYFNALGAVRVASLLKNVANALKS